MNAAEEPYIVTSSASVLQASFEYFSKSSTESKGPPEQQQLCGSGSSSLGGDLSGWQLVGAEASSGGAGSLALTVEDASMSDSESLASMEMLSDEAIAGLMLEDELSEALQPAAADGQEAGRHSHAPSLPAPADGTAPTDTATTDVRGIDIDLLQQLSRSYSEAPLTEVVFGQSDPSCGQLSSACQQSGMALSSTNPFTSTNPFLKDITAAPFASSEELLSKIDSVIRSTKYDADDNLDHNPFTAAVVGTASSNADFVKNLPDACISSVDRRVPSPSEMETRVLDTTVISSTEVQSSSFTFPSSLDKASLSPSRSPVNRPCSLPLTSLNNPACRGVPRPSTSYLPVVSSSSASSHRPEPVVLNSDSSSGSSDSLQRSNSDAEGVTRSSSAVSAEAWTPASSTPAYAPLHDALESPALGPPPDYPPPPPPRLLQSSTPSPE